MQDNKDFLGTEPIGKLLLKLSIPTVIAQLINMLYNIVDRIYIGHIPGNGSLALTGVGVCMPIIMIVSAFGALVSSGGAPRASIYMGKRDNQSAEQILSNCYTFHARCDENPSLVLEDGATRIFLNTRGTNRNEVSEELIQFLEYMEQSTLNVAIPDTNRNLIKIHNHVRQVKASEEIGVKFMQ